MKFYSIPRPSATFELSPASNNQKKNYYLECVISVQGAAGKVWSGRFDIKMSTGH